MNEEEFLIKYIKTRTSKEMFESVEKLKNAGLESEALFFSIIGGELLLIEREENEEECL